MNKEELRKRFIVGLDVLKERLEPLVTTALDYCVVAENGTVHITSKQLGPKDKIRLVLAARALAAQLSEEMSPEVSVRELAVSTGIPENQIRARANELLRERFATSNRRGFYVASSHRIEPFLESLPRN